MSTWGPDYAMAKPRVDIGFDKPRDAQLTLNSPLLVFVGHGTGKESFGRLSPLLAQAGFIQKSLGSLNEFVASLQWHPDARGLLVLELSEASTGMNGNAPKRDAEYAIFDRAYGAGYKIVLLTRSAALLSNVNYMKPKRRRDAVSAIVVLAEKDSISERDHQEIAADFSGSGDNITFTTDLSNPKIGTELVSRLTRLIAQK